MGEKHINRDVYLIDFIVYIASPLSSICVKDGVRFEGAHFIELSFVLLLMKVNMHQQYSLCAE